MSLPLQNTRRNLFAIDYIKNHGTITRDEFTKLWVNLGDEEKAVSGLPYSRI